MQIGRLLRKLLEKNKKQALDRAISGIGWENTDIRLARCIALLLSEFRDAPRTGYPAVLSSEGEWNNILDKMTIGFKNLANQEGVLDENEERALDESLRLFAIWFRHLWD